MDITKFINSIKAEENTIGILRGCWKSIVESYDKGQIKKKGYKEYQKKLPKLFS